MAYSFQNKASNVGVTVGELNEVVNNTPPYRVYTALLTQSGEDAPVATVLENTIGSLNLSYIGVGYYEINSNSLFTSDKTFFLYNGVIDGTIQITLNQTDESVLRILTSENNILQDELMFNTPIEIRVYN